MKIHKFTILMMAGVLSLCMSMILATTAIAAEKYDLVILDGRVMDPQTNFDGKRNVGVKDGKIVTEYDLEDYRNYFAYNYACQIAVVEVDTTTGEVEVKKIFAFHDVGKALNPLKIKGQLEGSIVMGIGYALSENFAMIEGLPKTKTIRGCGIPDFHVAPEIEIVLVEKPEPIGPFSAKGISEIALVPTVPAIINAICDATRARITSLPAKPAKVLEGLRRSA